MASVTRSRIGGRKTNTLNTRARASSVIKRKEGFAPGLSPGSHCRFCWRWRGSSCSPYFGCGRRPPPRRREEGPRQSREKRVTEVRIKLDFSNFGRANGEV